MTDLLYSKDSYLYETECKIVSIVTDGGLIFDKTIFYPGGGGQPRDEGLIKINDKDYTVNKLTKSGDDIIHYVSPEISNEAIGDNVIQKIDGDLRHKHSRTHTAMHILCGIIYNEYGSTVTGGDFKALSGRMDFDIDNFSKDRISFIEEMCNKAVEANYPVQVDFLKRDDAEKLPELIRTKVNLIPKEVSVIRTINIVGLDKQADGGTHVKHTGEVGKIKIVKVDNKGKGRRRIYLEIH